MVMGATAAVIVIVAVSQASLVSVLGSQVVRVGS